MTNPIMKFTQGNIDAIRSGRKTMTRRPIKPQPDTEFAEIVELEFMKEAMLNKTRRVADPDGVETDLLIKITGVRAERLQDIQLSDCAAEGAPPTHEADGIWDDTSTFQAIWRRIYGPTNQFAWERNPWVFVYEFEVVV